MSHEDKKTEEIREMLRKKLEALSPADDGWNVPSQDVWAGLSEELGAKASTKKTGGWLARLGSIIAALALILFWRECSNQRQLDELKTEIGSLSKAYQQLQQTCNENQSKDTGAAIGDTELPHAGEPRTTGQDHLTSKGISHSSSSFAKKNTRSPLNAFSSTGVGTSPGQEVMPEITATFSAPISVPQPMQPAQEAFEIMPAPVLLSFPPFSLLPLTDSKPELDFRLNQAHDPIGKNRLLFSLFGGVALTGNRLSGEKPDIIQRQKPLFAYRAGLGVETALSQHWSLKSGLLYNVSRIQTDYRLQVPFTHINEFQHDDGNFDNQYNHSLPSPLGNYPAQFVLTRQNTATVNDGEAIDLDLSIHQQTRFLSLPLLLHYGFGEKRLRAGIQAGVLANQSLGVSSEGSQLVSHHSAIHERHTSIGDPTFKELQKFTFDYSIGLDLRYQISPRWGLMLESNHQRAFTPVFRGEGVKNYLHQTNMGLGVLWQLGGK